MIKKSEQCIDKSYRLAVGGGGGGGMGQISQLGSSLLTAQQEIHRRQMQAEQMADLRRFMQNGANQYQDPVPIQTEEDNIQMDRKLLLIKR